MNRRDLVKSALCAMLLVPFSACGGLPFYSAAPIEGWVVDSATNQPLEGVIVTANWQLVSGSLAGGEVPKGQLMVMESVTDKAGRFFFEGWTKANTTTGELRDKDPQILMFKPGYRYQGFSNNYPANQILLGFKRESRLNRQTIKLEKFSDDLQAYARHFGLSTDLGQVLADCEWKRIPKMILALDAERSRLERLDSRLWVNVPSIETIDLDRTGCGSAREFFRGMKQ